MSHTSPETRVMGLSDGVHYFHDPAFPLLGTIPACDGRPDRQTDGPEMEMGQWVIGHGSNGSPFLDGSRGS